MNDILYRVSQKMYAKLIKRNLILIMSINGMQQFLDFKQSNLNFESLFVGIHEVLTEIRLSEHKFQARNFSKH